ncbi:MAG TPA: hypothetical protein VGL44_02615 [Gaiellales bacterium]
MLAAAAVAVRTATVSGGNGRAAVAVAAACAALLLAAAILARSEGAVVWAIALQAGVYVVALELRGGRVDAWAPAVAAALVGAAELGQWAVELARPAAVEAGITSRRAATILAVAASGAGVGWLLLLASNAGSRSVTLAAAGLAAAAAAMVLVRRLARST